MPALGLLSAGSRFPELLDLERFVERQGGTLTSTESQEVCAGAPAGIGLTPDATQPRVTVRPKPPVLLGATSETHHRHRSRIVSDNPFPGLVRRLQGSHHSETRYACCRKLLPAPAASPLRDPMPTLDPALRLSLGHLPVCLAASLLASLRLTLRRSVGVRRAFISELVPHCASCRARSMRFREIQTFSPPFHRSSPRGLRPSPTHPHGDAPVTGRPPRLRAA
jgi:hypothetical protein